MKTERRIKVHLSGDGCWPDIKDLVMGDAPEGAGVIQEAAYLEDGTNIGTPSVALRIVLSDGRLVIGQTTLRSFLAMAAELEAKARRDGFDL